MDPMSARRLHHILPEPRPAPIEATVLDRTDCRHKQREPKDLTAWRRQQSHGQHHKKRAEDALHRMVTGRGEYGHLGGSVMKLVDLPQKADLVEHSVVPVIEKIDEDQ